MRLSTTTGYPAQVLGEAQALRFLAEIGFDGVDYSSFYHNRHQGLWVEPIDVMLSYYRSLKKTADEVGIAFDQMHAPMPSYLQGSEENDRIFDQLVKAIMVCDTLDCPYLVIHPAILTERRYDHLRLENRALNLDLYSRLMPTIRNTRVKIGIENMFNWDPELRCNCPTVCSTAEEMIDYIDIMNEVAGEERFVACLDIGHTVITKHQPDAMIRALGSRLRLLHVHDNDGAQDHHDAPHTGVIDWPGVIAALKEINYSGTFSFEADNFMKKFGDCHLETSTKLLYEIGKELVSL